MDDMNAFDRQLASVVLRRVGPSAPVDDAAIFTAITPTQSPKWRFQSVFSAAKFVVAGAIVALFGGILLTGVLTQQPSDEPLPPAAASASSSPEANTPERAVRSDLLAGVELVIEEVEPGVYQVLSDGHREPSRIADDEDRHMSGILDGNIVAGLDGSVWWFGRDDFYRLGEGTRHRWPKRVSASLDKATPARLGFADLEVGLDGTVWLDVMPPDSGLWSYDGSSWTDRRQGRVAERTPMGVEVQPDGTVWTAWLSKTSNVRLARLGDAGWELLPGRFKGGRGIGAFGDPMLSAGDGTGIWLMPLPGLPLWRHDGEGWLPQATPDAGMVRRLAVGPDGTVWVRLLPDDTDWSDVLARFDGSDWDIYDASDGIPMMGDHYQGFPGFFEVAPDGSIWFNPDDERTASECDGVGSFDGTSLTTYMRGTCIYAMDVAPDGSVWLQAGESRDEGLGPIQTYVITPEAAAATG